MSQTRWYKQGKGDGKWKTILANDGAEGVLSGDGWKTEEPEGWEEPEDATVRPELLDEAFLEIEKKDGTIEELKQMVEDLSKANDGLIEAAGD